jgi:hypothetical protein
METAMFKIEKSEMVGASITAIGFIITILAKLFGATEGFWTIYTSGFKVTGFTMLGIGLLLTILSILKYRTSILDLKQKIDAGTLGITLAVSIIAVIVINILVIPHLPKTDVTKLPPDPTLRKHAEQVDNNFKTFFSLSIIIAGITVGAIPSIKFFKN